MKYQFAILGLWIIAIIATLLIIDEMAVFTYVGPLYAICTIGSVIIVRLAAREP